MPQFDPSTARPDNAAPVVAQSADGQQHIFPAGTPMDVVDRTMADYARGISHWNANAFDPSTAQVQHIQAPDGSIIAFPADMKDADIAAVMKREYPQPTEAQSWLSSPGARFLTSTADGFLGLSNTLAHGAGWLSSLGRTAPNPLSDYYDLGARVTAAAKDAIDKPTNAAVAAARNTPGYAAARQQANADEAKASLGVLDQVTAPFIPSSDAALAYAHQAASNAGNELTGKPITVTASDAANASADAADASLNAYRAAHPAASTAAALAPLILSMGETGIPAVKSLLAAKNATNAALKAAPSIADLKSAANAAYKTVDNSGMVIAQPAVRQMVDGMQADLANQGFHPALQPKTAAAFNALDAAANNNQTLQGMDVLRRIANNAVDPMNKSDAMMARGLTNRVDDFVGNLGPQDVIGNVDQPALDALSNARDLWGRAAKGQQIQDLMDKAMLNTQSMQSMSYGQALRTQFRQLANNRNAMARFAPDEQDAIRRVATGGPLENIARLIGKLAPDQVIPALAEGNTALTALMHGDPVTAGIAAGTAAAGATGKLAASAIQARNAARLSDLVRSGGTLPTPAPTLALPPPRALPMGLFGSGFLLANQQAQPASN